MDGKNVLWKGLLTLMLLMLGIAAWRYVAYPDLLDSKLVTLFRRPRLQSYPVSSTPTPRSTASPAQIIATVGSEKIYAKDLEYEYRLYPDLRVMTDEQMMVDKLVNDSIILQAAANERGLKLTRDIFDNPEKDLDRRLSTVDSVRTSFPSGEAFNAWINTQVPAFPVSMPPH